MVSFKLLILCAIIGVALSVPQGSNRKNQSKENARRKASQPSQIVEDSDEELTDQCPEPNGYFADAEQCDKYYDCRDGVITEKLCPDGMVFNDFSSEYEKCDLPFNIDCSTRPKLQKPDPSLHCRRKNGYFSHEEPNVCDKFYYCVDGKFNMITCPDGLVYNENAGICSWPDEAKRKGCSSGDVFQFQCPKVNETFGLTHPRYADPEDCQFFYVCINGDTPRRNGCKLGQVFDERQSRCEWARKVPECADWYKGQLTDEELDRLENPPTTARPSGNAPSRRKKPHRPSQRHAEEEA
ncbi:protein obstructor-E-like [Chrysoperla carnea]|uniref:protein obstructor-E-like n=1 Tax=Chrysoperla carnea TaxID=189513 RepID=UPI001D086165|nr:protein obstructor-E-like [Chrysoperla carnea]